MSDQDSRERALQADLRDARDALNRAQETIRALREENDTLRGAVGTRTAKMLLSTSTQRLEVPLP